MDPRLLALLAGLRLDLFCSSQRYSQLDLADAYIRGSQYAKRRYDWDAAFVGYEGDASIQAQYYVPMGARRPAVRRDLPKLIVSRLTAMAFGKEQWPELKIPGDADAEDYAKALCEEACIPERFIEARDKGGASGVVCFSFGFVDGKPKVRVHEGKYCRVLRWVDRDEYLVGAALKVYRYEQAEIIEGKIKQVPYYSVRYWDEDCEIVWNPVPERLARDGTWVATVKSFEARHNYGQCPFFWCQNLPDSEREDGISDFDGMLHRFDQINYLASATQKGTIANVDPTLVIKDDQSANSGVVRKGSENAIYSKGGAAYLELEGTAVKAGSDWCERLENWCLDEACVVMPTAATQVAKEQSGEAIKLRFMPMAAQCDKLRGQYGATLKRLLVAMLEASRRILSQPPGPIVTTADGRRVQAVATVSLPPRYEESTGTDGKPVVAKIERKPGTSSDLQLNWRSYFPPTPTDIQAMVTSATAAKGQLIAQKTAIQYTAQVFGVKDPDQESAEIDAEREATVELMNQPGPEGTFGAAPKGKGKADDEDDEA
jgi:hypothetical protein